MCLRASVRYVMYTFEVFNTFIVRKSENACMQCLCWGGGGGGSLNVK